MLRTGKRIPSLLTVKLLPSASLLSRLAPLWQHRLGFSMGCQHKYTISFVKHSYQSHILKIFENVSVSVDTNYIWWFRGFLFFIVFNKVLTYIHIPVLFTRKASRLKSCWFFILKLHHCKGNNNIILLKIKLHFCLANNYIFN